MTAFDLSRERRVAGASLLAACAAGLAAFAPEFVAAAIGVVALPFLPRSALFRTGFLVAGGLVVLHSGVDRLTADKVVYALGVAIAVVIAVSRALRRWNRNELEPLHTLWPLLIAFAALCVIWVPVASEQSTSPSDWVRDTSAYALLALVPLFVSDLAAEVADWLVLAALFGPLAAASTVSFGLEWLYRRKVLDFDASIGLPSFLFPAALFSFAVSAALLARGRRVRLASLAVATAVFGLLLATGTRTTFVLLAGVLPLLVVARRPSRMSLITGIAGLLVAAGSIALVAASIDGRIGERLRDIPETIRNPTADDSYRYRANAWRAAWDELGRRPVLGVGPGFRFTWSLPRGTSVRHAYNVDSPLGFPAKFGLLGLVFLAAAITALIRFMASTYKRSARVPWWAGLSFCLIVLVWTPFGVPMEDKGLSFGLLWLLAMVAVSVGSSSEPFGGDPGRAAGGDC